MAKGKSKKPKTSEKPAESPAESPFVKAGREAKAARDAKLTAVKEAREGQAKAAGAPEKPPELPVMPDGWLAVPAEPFAQLKTLAERLIIHVMPAIAKLTQELEDGKANNADLKRKIGDTKAAARQIEEDIVALLARGRTVHSKGLPLFEYAAKHPQPPQSPRARQPPVPGEGSLPGGRMDRYEAAERGLAAQQAREAAEAKASAEAPPADPLDTRLERVPGVPKRLVVILRAGTGNGSASVETVRAYLAMRNERPDAPLLWTGRYKGAGLPTARKLDKAIEAFVIAVEPADYERMHRDLQAPWPGPRPEPGQPQAQAGG
jgi:hypothetical protein